MQGIEHIGGQRVLNGEQAQRNEKRGRSEGVAHIFD
jgi:hypothetical protein